jgi:hypothetical protein
MIPSEVKTNTIPPGTSAKPRPTETINATRAAGGEVRRGEYASGHPVKLGAAGFDVAAGGYSSHGNQTGEAPAESGCLAYSDHGSQT